MPRFDDNLILLVDSNRVSEYKQYFPGTDTIYSYFEVAQGSKYKEICFFGLQYILMRYFVGPVITREKIMEAEMYFANHFGDHRQLFNRHAWEYIVERHYGHLPLIIKALPEGSVVPPGNVMFTVENTDPKCYWLPNYVESILRQVWYPIAVASNSREMRKMVALHLEKTGTPGSVNEISRNKIFDTGYSSCSSVETAGIGGCAHLVNFKMTNTMAAVVHAAEYYREDLAGSSMPCSEYSTMTTWGGRDHEMEACKNMMSQFPANDVGVLSDSYDVYGCCRAIWGNQLKDMILRRNGCTMIQLREMGSNPEMVVAETLRVLSQFFDCIELLGPGSMTSYKLLPDMLRVFVHDAGKDAASISKIYTAIEEAGFAAENIYFGAPALQEVCAGANNGLNCMMEVALTTCMGQTVNVYKDPATNKEARSRRGIQTVEMKNDVVETIGEGKGDAVRDMLVEVFSQGKLLIEQSLGEIRERAKIGDS